MRGRRYAPEPRVPWCVPRAMTKHDPHLRLREPFACITHRKGLKRGGITNEWRHGLVSHVHHAVVPQRGHAGREGHRWGMSNGNAGLPTCRLRHSLVHSVRGLRLWLTTLCGVRAELHGHV